ncbi:MAG TPA: CheR family methyltransferase [Candidatus Deferrimicrobiaceae bacterium]|jgi:chemotaxis protein methyltransferase CheR
MPQPLPELLSPEQFAALRESIERASGIVLGSAKLSHLDSAVRERMAACGDVDVTQYLARIGDSLSAEGECRALVTSLLVGETSFFRTTALYRVLERSLFPELRSGGMQLPLEFWSAGCATGEEPYSVAIAALEAFGSRIDAPVRILATDLHAGFLDVAREGVYPASALRDAPPHLVMKYFQALSDGRFRVIDAVKRLVRFEHRNLADATRHKSDPERFSAILCRNVMIYFAPGTTRKVVAGFHERLADGGLLFLGHSETLWGISEAFRLEERDGLFFYRKKNPGAPPVPQGSPVRPFPTSRRPGPPLSGSPTRARATASAPAVADVPVENRPMLPPTLPVGRPTAAGAEAAALGLALQAERMIDRDLAEEAEGACREALALDPVCPEAEYLTAVLLRRRGRCEEALMHAARALLADPLFVQGAVELAECMAILGRKSEAAAQWHSLAAMLDKPVHFPRLSPATGMTVSALRDYVASRIR